MLGDLRACPKYSESTKSLFGRRIAMEESTAKSLRSRTMLTFPTVPSLENSTSPRIGAELPAAAFSNSSLAIFEQPSRSEEHTSDLQSLMRNSYAVFYLKKQTHH